MSYRIRVRSMNDVEVPLEGLDQPRAFPIDFDTVVESDARARITYNLLLKRFPANEGWVITVHDWRHVGNPVSWAPASESEAMLVHPTTDLREAGIEPRTVAQVRADAGGAA